MPPNGQKVSPNYQSAPPQDNLAAQNLSPQWQPTPAGVLEAPVAQAVSSLVATEPVASPSELQMLEPAPLVSMAAAAPGGFSRRIRIVAGSALAVMVVAAVAGLALWHQASPSTARLSDSAVDAQYANGALPLSSIGGGEQIALNDVQQLSVNGQLTVSDSLVLAPGHAPVSPQAGQIYYDKTTNAPYYFDGQQFVSLAPTPESEHVTSIANASGAITLGSGLTVANNRLSLSSSVLGSLGQTTTTSAGVTSVQGQSGAVSFSAGPGISINGTTISNTGVTSLLAGNGIGVSGNTITNNGVTALTSTDNSVTVTPNGSGSFDLSVTAAGGTAILIGPGSAQTDSSNNDAININKTGSGNLIHFASNGIDKFIVDQTGQIVNGLINYSQVVGAPVSTVTSLNGASGAISLGSGLNMVGSTLSNSGVTAINGTTHQVIASAGTGALTLSLPQDIDTTSAPTFNGATLNNTLAVTTGGVNVSGASTFNGNLSVQGAGGLTLGSSSNLGLLAFLDGSNDGFTGRLQLGAALSADQAYDLPVTGGTICVKEAGNCTGANSGGVTATGTPSANTIALFTGSSTISNSALTQLSGNIIDSGNLSVQGPGGLILGNGSNTVALLAGASGTPLSFTLPTADGGGGQCLTTDGSGQLSFADCLTGAGAGGGVTDLNGTSGSITIQGTADEISVTGSGTITLSTPQAIATTSSPTFAGLTLGSPLTIANGGTGQTSSPVSGQLLIGTASGNFALANLTAGTGVSIGNGSGSISVAVANTAVTAGSYGDASDVATFSVNAQGQLTNATSTPIAINGNQITSGTVGDGFLSTNVALYNNATSNFTGNLQQGGNGVCTTAGNCSVGSGIGPGSAFVQNGNTFGATALLGTTDNFGLQLETDGVVGLAIDTSQNVTTTGSLTVQGGVVTLGAVGTTAGVLALASPASGGSVGLLTDAAQSLAVNVALPNLASNDVFCLVNVGNCTGVNSGSGNTAYIFNQTAQQTDANINILARASSVAASIQGASGQDILDLVANAGGTPVAKVDSAGNLTVVGLTAVGTVSINASGAGTTTIGGASAGAFTLRSGNVASTINTGTATLAITSSKLTVDTSGNTILGGTLTIQGTTQTFSGAGTISNSNIATSGGTGSALTLRAGNETGSNSTGGSITVDAGTGNSTNGSVKLGTTNAASLTLGNTTKTNTVNILTNALSTSAFTVQNASGFSILTGDTKNSRVAVGGNEVSYINPNWGSGGPFAAGSTINVTASGRYYDYGVGVADFNNDGYPDFVAGTQDAVAFLDPENSLFLNNADGTGNYTYVRTLNGASSCGSGRALGIVAADFTGDGFPDFVSANHGSTCSMTSVSYFKNNGTGTNFTGPTSIIVGTDPNQLAAGDLSGDGHPDVVVSNGGSANISVLTNNGSGTFAAAVNYNVGNGPIGVAIGDVNGDGHPDVAVANSTDGTVGVLMNNGSGNLVAQVTYTVGTAPWGVAISDVNGDGHPDLVVSNRSNANVSVLMNNGDGTFATQVTYNVGTNPDAVTIRDMNGDTYPDIVAANNGSASVSILQNNGDGTFATAINVGVVGSPITVTTADANGDGRPDIFATNSQSPGYVSVILNNTGGASSYRSTLSVTATNANEGGLYIQGATGQAANLFGVQDASGDVYLSVAANGDLTVGGNLSLSGATALSNLTPTSIALTVKGTASQSADLMDLQNNSGQVLASFNNSGQLMLGNVSAGSAAGKLSLADGTNDGFLVSIATAVQGNNVALSIPADTNATDTFCLVTLANCGGGLSGSGTLNQVAYFTGSGTLSSSSLLSLDATNGILTVTTTSATALTVTNGTSVVFVVDAGNGRVGINTGATAPGTNLTVNGGNNINLSWPDGLVGTPVYQCVNNFGTNYTVPSGKSLYITSVNNHSGDSIQDSAGNIIYVTAASTTTATLITPLAIAANTVVKASGSSLCFAGLVVNAGVTPIWQQVNSVSTSYTVPAGKILYVTTQTGSGNLIDSTTSNIYFSGGATATTDFNMPIPVAAGTVLESSSGTIQFTGYLTNANGYGGP